MLSKAACKRVLVFLDYDGTLTPIVCNPDEAFMSQSMRDTVRAVGETFPTAIISGRGRSKVESFVQLPELFYAGSHGLDIKGPVVRLCSTVTCWLLPLWLQTVSCAVCVSGSVDLWKSMTTESKKSRTCVPCCALFTHAQNACCNVYVRPAFQASAASHRLRVFAKACTPAALLCLPGSRIKSALATHTSQCARRSKTQRCCP